LLAIALGADAFSVGLGLGVCGATFRQTFRLALHFGIFQFFMPILGGLMAREFLGTIASFSKLLAFLLLIIIGTRMIYAAFKGEASLPINGDRTKGWSLVFLSLATSIDALGAGVGMGLLISNLLTACLVIGITASLMTTIGIRLGCRLGQGLGSRAEAVGGGILVALAFKFLLY